MPTERDDGREQWHTLLRAWSVDHSLADRKFDDLCRRYSESGRFYHALCHVLEVLSTVESLGHMPRIRVP